MTQTTHRNPSATRLAILALALSLTSASQPQAATSLASVLSQATTLARHAALCHCAHCPGPGLCHCGDADPCPEAKP